jgi:hypothetical protein
MAPLDQLWVDERQAEIDATLANASLTTGLAPDGTPYSLSPAEIEMLRAKGHQFAQEIPKYYFRTMVNDVVGFFVTSPLDGDTLEILADVRARIGHDAVFDSSHETMTATVTIATETATVTRVVTVQMPLFDQDDRLAAVALLTGDAPRSDWLTDRADALKAEIEDAGLAAFGVPWEDLVSHTDQIPHPMRKWVEDLIALHDGIGAEDSAAPPGP